MYQIDTIQKKSGAAVSPLGNFMFNTHTHTHTHEIKKVMMMPKDKISFLEQ